MGLVWCGAVYAFFIGGGGGLWCGVGVLGVGVGGVGGEGTERRLAAAGD